MMGFKTSPYAATYGSSIAEYFIRGDEKEIDNPLRWNSIILNLPGKWSIILIILKYINGTTFSRK